MLWRALQYPNTFHECTDRVCFAQSCCAQLLCWSDHSGTTTVFPAVMVQFD